MAGLAAAERFDISAAQLATFTMLQLLVYAGMQIPVGLLVDRYGPRSVLLTGAIVLTLAQTGFALAESFGAALAARVFVGMGDAMTWICLLRLVTSWFSGRRIPFITALSGTLGQLGAIGAAVPMTWALGHLGWTKAYLIAAAVSVVATVAVAIVVHDAPEGRVLRGPRLTFAAIRRQPAGLLVAAGHPAGFLDALRHPVQCRRDDAALGLPLLRQGRAPHRGPGRPPAHPRGRRRDVQRADDRVVHRPASVAPLDDRAVHRVLDRRRLDGGARLAGRRAVLAPRPAHPGRRDRRAGVDDRVRPRPGPRIQPSGSPAPTGSSTRPASRPAWSSSSRSA